MQEPLNSQELSELIIEMLDGAINDSRLRRLESLLAENPQAMEAYQQMLGIYVVMKDAGVGLVQSADMLKDNRQTQKSTGKDDSRYFQEIVEQDLANSSICSQAAPMAGDDAEPVERAVLPQRPRRNKRDVIRLVSRVAAVILVCVLIIWLDRWISGKMADRSRLVVARLSHQMDARWDESLRLPGGDGQLRQDHYGLKSGLVDIEFNDGSTVVVEGPAQWQMTGAGSMELICGRLYATVPQQAIGFTVKTAKAKIVDMGTEFGVEVDKAANVDLHVIKGQTCLVAQPQGEEKSNQIITAGNARHVRGEDARIDPIKINPDLFVRKIQPEHGVIWRGQRSLDLADVAGGGSGFGAGRLETGINPLSGPCENGIALDRLGKGRYLEVKENPYVDGVFVPDGHYPKTVISSAGHLFGECPKTNNIFHMELINGKARGLFDFIENATLGGQEYGTPACPSIFMHANLGVTFDLAAIRGDLEGMSIKSFTATTGLTSSATRKGNADIWVLVDGKVRFCQKKITAKGKAWPVDIALSESDRFLTLIVTDGGDVDYPKGLRGTDCDWCLFAQPRLLLTEKNP